MAKRSLPSGTDRRGAPVPVEPNDAAIERYADRLRIVPDAELPDEAINRRSLDELEERRRKTTGT